RKHGTQPVPKVHPLMDDILDETYGIMVYQEQVMRIFNRLGGIPLRAAYGLIKAISKKKSSVIAKFRPKFIEGAHERGLEEHKAKEVFELILKFGGYGFNKSHSTRYAIVAYQTAYMKTYHPVEYMAALLTFEAGNADKMVEYLDECGRVMLPAGDRGVKVLPPDVNTSGHDFTPVYDKKKPPTVRFGMGAVRGVGSKAVEAIVTERDEAGAFESLFDFCERVDTRAAGKSTLDALIRCGAFASLHKKRAPLVHALDRAFEMGQQAQEDKRAGQAALFGAPEPTSTSSAESESLPKVKEFDPSELLQFEKELLGFYLSDHPLAEHQAAIDRYATATTKSTMDLGEGTEVLIGCMISSVRTRVAKSGKSAGRKWAIVELEDVEGKIEGICFADTFEAINEQQPGLLKADSIVFVRGNVDRKRETPCLLLHEVLSVSDAAAKLTTAIRLDIDPHRHTPETITQLKPILEQHRGGCDVYARIASDKLGGETKTLVLRFARDLRVCPDANMIGDVERLLGPGSVTLAGQGTRRQKASARSEVGMSNGELSPDDHLA
ncbi:MAG: hypothetical protein AAGI46_15040, partial [Planctomycetota bacterium]